MKQRFNEIARDLRRAVTLGNKGQAIGLGEMPQVFVLMGVGVFAIVLVAVLVQALVDSQPTPISVANGTGMTAARNISVQGLSAFSNAGTLLPILGLGVMAVVIIGVLFLIFRNR